MTDPRLTALNRQIANRSAREYQKLGRGLSRGMRGLQFSGLIGSSEQEELLVDIAERKAQVESESTAARDTLRDQIAYEEEQKRGANLRNALSIGGTLLGAAANTQTGDYTTGVNWSVVGAIATDGSYWTALKGGVDEVYIFTRALHKPDIQRLRMNLTSISE